MFARVRLEMLIAIRRQSILCWVGVWCCSIDVKKVFGYDLIRVIYKGFMLAHLQC